MSALDRLDARSVGAGAVAGVAAYALGYLVTYLTQRGSVDERLSTFNFLADLFGGDPIPAWQGVGWLFYNAHLVDTEVPALGGTRTENLVLAADDGSISLLLALPPLLLLLGGLAAAYFGGVTEPGAGAVHGATVAVGYLPLAAAGVFVFAYSVGDGAVQPDPITGVLLAGLVYPLLFGAVGGVIGSVVGERT